MVAHTRVAGWLAACVMSAVVAACAARAAPSSELMARCSQLYTAWWTYDQDPVFLHTGERVRAELALDGCQHGVYESNIQELQKLLEHSGFRFPDSEIVHHMTSPPLGETLWPTM